ncbi:DUF4435 domain-containing protein [uncultured Duncaniella sp.]|nr:DUF4435 domain-containing protein [uncultured Duncaniella sp.]
MRTSLTDAADSAYVEAQSYLRSSTRLPEIIIYVEGWADVAFWTECVRPYMNKYKFSIEVFRHPDGAVADGKRHLMENVDDASLGQHLLLAVDADYDWIVEDYRPSATSPSLSRRVCDNPYILHTYLYSIENYKCHAACLPGLISKATAVTPTYECQLYMSEYSKAISPLFLAHLVSVDMMDGVYTLKAFIRDANRLKMSFNPIALSKNSEEFLSRRISELSEYMDNNGERIRYYIDKLAGLGFDRERYYLLFQGHCVADTIVKPRFISLISSMRVGRIRAIQQMPDVQQACQHIANYCDITGIGEANTFPEVERRLRQLINDCTEIHKATEGYRFLKADLDRLFA